MIETKRNEKKQTEKKQTEKSSTKRYINKSSLDELNEIQNWIEKRIQELNG